MKITILTLFPEMFQGPFEHSIVKRAKEKDLLSLQIVNIRDFGLTRHQTVDDTPFGGGIGMVMRVDVIHNAIKSVTKDNEKTRIVLLDARGKTYNQERAEEFTQFDHLILICGHYEGVDERIRSYIDEEVSIGDFILTGGEIPAMLITDSIARLIPNVLKEGATTSESFTLKDSQNNILLEHPHYTQPREYEGKSVPDILLSGNHAEIEKWRKEMSEKITKKHRPDLIKKG